MARRQLINNGFWSISQDLDSGLIEINDGSTVVDSFYSEILTFEQLGDKLVTYRAQHYLNMK